MVRGIQSQGVASTLKHYAAYSVPKGGRDGNCRTDPHIAPRELHQMYLYPFRRVIRESGPMGVMSSYNDWDGVPVTASRYFLTDLLRHEYGFDGYVVSDSEAVEYVHTKHAVAETYEDAVRQVLEAGLNVAHELLAPGAVHSSGAQARPGGTPLDGGRGPARARGPAGKVPPRALRQPL